MRRLIGSALVAALTLVPGTARAQNPCDGTLHTPAVGSWAEWRMVRAADTAGSMRLALIGKESREGTDLTRLEMQTSTPRGKVIMQMVVPGWPYEPSGIEEMVMKTDGRPAMKMPTMMLNQMRNRAQNPTMSMKENCRKMVVVGQERVTVPAGSFVTTHLRNTENGAEVWVSKDVPFGMVKSRTEVKEGRRPGPVTMELLDSGTGAKSSITETPQEMPGMGGMGRRGS